ncbi:MAG: GFA family protein [Rhodobiaceae bacterium]|nr:GFA family protein [Rhodobiaceae bacterium]
MIKGSCLCGAVTLEISGTPSSLSYCHCSRCRKAAGVFSAVLIGPVADLKITSGECHIARLEPEAPNVHRRAFCEHCGSSLGDLATDSGIYVVAASILDDDPGIKPMGHIHTASKPDWYEITDSLQQFDGDYVPPD